ncbi:MAG TPA: hypothetical protein ENK88_03650 [Campylobacterales bacterium]|nr:hypothetical protein [Campylobacterales bacterium]
MSKRLVKPIIKTVVYLFVAIIFFLKLINFMQFPIVEKSSVVERNITSELASLQKIRDNGVEMELIKRFSIDYEDNSTKSIEEYIFFDYVLNNNNKVIPFIYLLTLLTFLLQTMLLAWSSYYKDLLEFFSEKKLDSIFLYSSEWAINAPPVLGVVGTIFSFGMVVGNLEDMSSLSTIFKDNFPNAALTTIIGGTVYVLNLCMNIFIAKNLADK